MARETVPPSRRRRHELWCGAVGPWIRRHHLSLSPLPAFRPFGIGWPRGRVGRAAGPGEKRNQRDYVPLARAWPGEHAGRGAGWIGGAQGGPVATAPGVCARSPGASCFGAQAALPLGATVRARADPWEPAMRPAPSTPKRELVNQRLDPFSLLLRAWRHYGAKRPEQWKKVWFLNNVVPSGPKQVACPVDSEPKACQPTT